MEQKLLKLLDACRGTLEWPVVVPHGPTHIADHVLITLRRLGISALVVAHQGRPYLVSGPHITSFESWKLHCAATDAPDAVAPALILTQRYTLAVTVAMEAHKQLEAAVKTATATAAASAADAPADAAAAAADSAATVNAISIGSVDLGPIPLDEWARRTREFKSAAAIALRLPA